MAIALTALAALAVAMGVGRFAFTPLLPMMQSDSALSLAQGGYLASANYVGYLVGALVAARVSISISGALVTIGAVTVAMAFTHSLDAWLALRFLAGVASAWALVGVSSWSLGALQRPLHGGFVFSGVGVGVALAGAVCLALMAHGASSADAWMLLGLASFGITALVWPILPRTRRPGPRPGESGYAWGAEAWRLVGCYGAFGFGYIIPATFVPAMARDAIQDPAVFGWAWPAFGATAAASTVVAALWLPALGNRRVWMLAALAMASGVSAPVIVPGMAGIVLSAVLVGGTFMVITMAGMQEARRIAGEHAAPLMGAMTAAFAAGQIAGPLVVSALVHVRGGFSAALAIGSAALVISAFALRIREKPCLT